MSTEMRDLGAFRSLDAVRFIEDHGLSPTIDEISDRLCDIASQDLPVKKVEVTLSPNWDGEPARLRVTVRFDTDLLGAYRAWKDVRPALAEAAFVAEEKGLLDFEFATANP